MQKKISIIVPVYNGEKYLRRCIDSLLSQEFDISSMEMLFLNDGSKDNSLSILYEYETDNKSVVKVIDQANMGAAKTRNKGIQLAKGKYIVFVDQDDFLDANYCKMFFDVVDPGGYDVVQGGFRLVDAVLEMIDEVKPRKSEFGKLLAMPAWAKIHRTDFLKEHDIKFFENNIGEDIVFTTKEIMCEPKYRAVDFTAYNHFEENAESVTNALHHGLSRSVNIIRLLEELQGIEVATNQQKRSLDYIVLRTATYYILQYGKYASSARFVEASNEVSSWLRFNLPHHTNLALTAPKEEMLKVRVGIMLFTFMNHTRLTKVFAKVYCRG